MLPFAIMDCGDRALYGPSVPALARVPKRFTFRPGVRLLCPMVVILVAVGVAGCAPSTRGSLAHTHAHVGNPGARGTRESLPKSHPPTTSTATSTTTTTTLVPVVAPLGSVGPLTSPPLPPPGLGFQPGLVTAIGDSVMLDAQRDLEEDIPGIQVHAAVSRQWVDGEGLLTQLKAAAELGAVVVVALGTNGPITSSDFAQMMMILSGASRIVFVTVHVDRPWQDQVNQVLEIGAEAYPRVVIANWYFLGSENPSWFASDGTHLPIDGPGAKALAQLIASDV